MQLKLKPWWLFVTPCLACVTLYPVIYYPEGHYPSGAVLAHEAVHLTQQQGHKWRWLGRYLWSRSFRLSQEAEAIRAEIQASPEWRRDSLRTDYAELLASRYYGWAAGSYQQAIEAIG